MNLLKETIEDLKLHGKSPSDVMWVGNLQHWTTWSNFEAIADNEYHSGFGAQEVATDLLIVGHDWWMSRSEYDGSESWEFHIMPEKPFDMRKIDKVMPGMWDTLSEMNGWDEE
jgi:hypothetical protein